MTPHDLHAYLQRLGEPTPPPPTLATLARLQQRHNATFPFETLTCLLRDAVAIDLPSVAHKLLHEGRGGYCYELNGLFLALLQHLGFQARALAARVVMDASDDSPTARTHMLVLVVIDGVAYSVDVGFGGNTPTGPLRLDQRFPQATPHERYRMDQYEDAYLLRVDVGGEWRPLYRFDLQVQEAVDHIVGNWYVCTHPASSFPGQLRAALSGPGWRRTLGAGRYAVHRHGQPSERRALVDVDDVLQVLREDFGINPPTHPRLRDAIAAWLRGAA
ncbi:arylamine N-acetyltransferase [Stenotrophomonas sp.]|uniref:arylamine N-acetyltransferase family protein n=1 Tax=Stenotrophomonas sp. TaxID=69392 RepID=UPI00140FD9E8|nr:arylamine N-acetyltransferase [Stenotrophomonas sp.]